MWYGLIIGAVLILWKAWSFVDTYLDGKLADRAGKALIMMMATVAVIAPTAFAAGTKQFIEAEQREWSAWLVKSIGQIIPEISSPTPRGRSQVEIRDDDQLVPKACADGASSIER